MDDLEEQAVKILSHYRINADMAWSEVKDGVYTEKQYVNALKRINKRHVRKVRELVNSAIVGELEKLMKNGHGGGNFRRLITTRIEELRS